MEKGGNALEDDDYVTYEGAQLDLSGSPLHAISWSRIILDEAHRIKGRTNSTAMAAYALQADNGFKWCLTGTPLQNRVGELYSLIRFLRVRPYAFYYCKIKGCKCECARFMRDRYCPNCGHVRFCHYSCFKSKVSNPIIKYGYMGAGKAAFQTLRHDILNRVMLRRTKEERKSDLKLPPIKVHIRKDKLSKQESDFYSSLYMQSCVKFDTFIKSGTILHNYAHIFDLLTSLRRAVDHPYLIVYGGAQNTHKLPDGHELKIQGGDVCGLCQDDVKDDGEEGETKRVAKCGHVFHDECIRDYIADAPKLKSGGVGCPVCFTKLNVDLDEGGGSDAEAAPMKAMKAPKTRCLTPAKCSKKASVSAAPQETSKGSKGQKGLLALPAPQGSSASSSSSVNKQAPTKGIMKKVRASEFQSSTKIEALLDEVNKMMRSDKTAKAIVFSQFGAMLELVEFRMKKAGISCVVFRGGMSMQAREDALAAFNDDPSLKVILISLKAGGEGLNLQVANHVFLLDPWWNPACEMQAIQRAHRIGQTREVKAVRFITKDTVEEKILQLQEKKQLVFDASIDGSAASLGKLTEQDLRFLFQH
jgi:DNA repair protein RAD16